ALDRVRPGSAGRRRGRPAHRAPRHDVARGRLARPDLARRARHLQTLPQPRRGGAAVKIQRRTILKGIGGFSLTLPFLEGLKPKTARAADETFPPYAIFLRQANGVAAAQNTELGSEPERFWPTQTGALSEATVAGRALDELSAHLSRLLVVGNVR